MTGHRTKQSSPISPTRSNSRRSYSTPCRWPTYQSCSWTATLEPLLDHEDAGIRLQTAVLLSRDGNRAAVAYLKHALRDPEPEARQIAATALADAGHTVNQDVIRRLLDDPVVNVQRAAMDLVTHLSPERARGILRGVLARPDPEESLHGLALLLLRGIGGPEDVAAVLAMLRATESDFLAVQAVGALGEMEGRLGTRSCLPELRRILEDPEADYALVSAAITALHQVGNPSFLPLLAARTTGCPPGGARSSCSTPAAPRAGCRSCRAIP